MKRIYYILLCFAVFFMFNGCQKDHTPTDPEQTALQSKQDITSLYQVTSKYGLHRFTKKYGNLTPDFKAIATDKVDGQEVISLPLRMDISSNVTLQLVMVKEKQGETYAQISEFIADPTSKKGAGEVNGTLTIYRVNGFLYKKYQVTDGKTSLITDSPLKKAGAGSSNNGAEDEDSDGVMNNEDKCPNTPADTWVDPNGCPVDNDLPEVVVPNPNPGPGTGLPGDGGYNPNPGGPDPGWPGDGGGTGPDGGSLGGNEGYYIYNKVSNPCLRAMVAGIIDRDINFKANESMKSIFGVNGKFNLIYHDTTGLANDVNGNATPSKIYFDANGNLLSMDVDIQLNVNNLPGSSQEYIAMVAVHEAIHAYLDYKGYAFSNNQHDVMLANYVDLMAKYLTDNYNMPSADAYSVAMGGLYEAFQNSVNNQTWNNIASKLGNKLPSLNDRSRILADYETGHKGKKCN